MSNETDELAGRIGRILDEGPRNAEGLVFRDWGRDKQPLDFGQAMRQIQNLKPTSDEDLAILQQRILALAHHPIPESSLRSAIAEEVSRQLSDYPGIISAREFIRVVGKTHDGRTVRGMLYFEEDEHATDPMVPAVREHVPGGICWACGGHGEGAEMMWHGAHLIHATPECIRGAEIKPETREHRG